MRRSSSISAVVASAASNGWRAILIVAGPTGDEGSFALYRWSGKRGDVRRADRSVDLGSLRPEALFAVPQTANVMLLSDDGGVVNAGVECKKLPRRGSRFGVSSLRPGRPFSYCTNRRTPFSASSAARRVPAADTRRMHRTRIRSARPTVSLRRVPVARARAVCRGARSGSILAAVALRRRCCRCFRGCCTRVERCSERRSTTPRICSRRSWSP